MADYGQFENPFMGGVFLVLGSSDSTSSLDNPFLGGALLCASQVSLQDVSVDASGGSIAGGQPDLLAVRVNTAVGGALGGGIALQGLLAVITIGGGALAGGLPGLTVLRIESAIGGSVAGYEAGVYILGERIISGGGIAGGEPEYGFGFYYTPLGGAIGGGEGLLGPRVESKILSGGGISGGVGLLAKAYTKLAIGGAVVGGAISPYVVTRALASIGGAIGGGYLGTLGFYGTEVGRPFWGVNLSSDPVWAFTEQPNKWGYLNNPRWVSPPTAPVNYDINPEDEPQLWEHRQLLQSAGTSIKHIPCGHWHKVIPTTPVENIDIDIYGLFSKNGDEIWGVNFNGQELTYMGVYNPGGVHQSGLLMQGDNVMTVADIGANAEIRFIDGQNFTLVSTESPFNAYDVTANVVNSGNPLTQLNSDIYFVTSADGYLIHLSSTYGRIARAGVGTVVTGTDGHLYQYKYVYGGFAPDPDWRPITGDYYAILWRPIPDDLHDGDVAAWGGYAYGGPGTWIGVVESSTHLFVLSVGSPSSKLHKISKSGYHLVANSESYYMARSICYYEGDLFIGGSSIWPGGAGIWKLNQSDLSYTDFKSYDGWTPYIIGAGGYLIVLFDGYAGSRARILKINTSTLEVEGATDDDDIQAGQVLLNLNDRFVAVGCNNGMAVLDITTMTIVDYLGTPLYVRGFGHKCMTCKDNSIYT